MKYWEEEFYCDEDALSQYLCQVVEVGLTAANQTPGSIMRAIDVEIDADEDEAPTRGVVIGLNFNRCSPEVQAIAEQLLKAVKGPPI